MFDFNWDEFKGKLLIQSKTIKMWCAENNIDIDRCRNIQQGRTQPTPEEIKLFKAVVEG